MRFEARLRSHRAVMERGVARAGRRGEPVVVGPWLSEVGFELLYWIPMLRRLLSRHGVAREQVTAISRGGAAPWYADVAERYVDVLDLVSVEEFRRAQHERVATAGDQKQLLVTRADRELWWRARAAPARVHPLVMYSRLRYLWAREEDLEALDRRCEYRPLAGLPAPLTEVPARFVAVKPYFSSCFPPTAANRRFVAELVRRLADEVDVVLLTTGLQLDDHLEPSTVEHERVHCLHGAVDARHNLDEQTRIVARAHALVATYGGPSYLAPFLGLPSVSVASEANHNPVHLEVAHFVARRLGAPPPALIDTTALGAVELAAQAALTPTSAANCSGGGSSASAAHGRHASNAGRS